jgi:hypothetical protein
VAPRLIAGARAPTGQDTGATIVAPAGARTGRNRQSKLSFVYQCVSQSLKCCQYSVVSSRYNRMPESKNHFANRV